MSPASGGWHTGRVGLLVRRHAATAHLQLCLGPGVWGCHVASLCGAPLSWAPQDPPGFRCFRCSTSSVLQRRVTGAAGGHLLYDAPSLPVITRRAGCRLHRCASGHRDFQPARGKVRQVHTGWGQVVGPSRQECRRHVGLHLFTQVILESGRAAPFFHKQCQKLNTGLKGQF